MASKDWKNGVIVGCVIGLFIGTTAIGLVIRTIERARTSRAIESWKLKPVVVYGMDVPAGTPLDYKIVAKMTMPEQFVTPSVVKPLDFEKIVGLKLRYAVKRGDVVVYGQFDIPDPAAGEPVPLPPGPSPAGP